MSSGLHYYYPYHYSYHYYYLVLLSTQVTKLTNWDREWKFKSSYISFLTNFPMNEIVFTTIDGIDELPNKEFESRRGRNKHHQVLYVCMYLGFLSVR